MDLEDICDGIADLYAPGTIGTPTGAQAMRASYGQAPHSMPSTPSVVVFPQSGEIIHEGQQRRGEHEINVDFFLSKAPGDIERVETQRQRWLAVLLGAMQNGVKLGLSSYVDKALPVSWEFLELPYGGDSYDGIRITYHVWTTETFVLTP